MKNAFLASLILLQLASCSNHVEHLNLSGEWTVRLDSTDSGISESWSGKLFENKIMLPGTTDAAKLGTKCTLTPELTKPQLLHLTRAYSYIGPAWYTREVEIPVAWAGRRVELSLERVIWTTDVWVDGVKAGSGEQKIEWVKRNCDLLRMLEKEFSETKPFVGKKIALSVHLEAKTAYLCRVLWQVPGGDWREQTLELEPGRVQRLDLETD